MFSKKSINKFGKIYEYLKSVDLRLEEIGRQRILIKGADFGGEKFNDAWGYCDFVDCDFTSGYQIMLKQLADCSFTGCNFRGIFGFGSTRNTRFLRCKISGESHLVFGWKAKNLIFEECEFKGPTAYDPNHIGSISSGSEIEFINCSGRSFSWEGNQKLVLKNCVTNNVVLGMDTPDSDEEQLYSDFLLEDCDFTGGVEMSNAKLNSLTLRNCKVGVFRTIGSIVLGDVSVEGIKEGHVKLSASSFRGKLTVRSCSFYQSYEEHSFRCGGCVPAHTLLENITCSSAPADVVSTYGPRKEWKNPPPNKSFIIRHCKIPHLKADWAQTEHLRFENCELGDLYLRNGRIGRLEIIECSLAKLDVTNTQVQTQDVRIVEGKKLSGHITVTTGSNVKLYPR